MLLQLHANHPEAVVPIVRNTPVAMTVFSVSGAVSALAATPHRARALAAWLTAAALAFALLARGRADAQYDLVRRLYRLPGSVVPLLLIVGVFLVKYGVGVDLAMAPQQVQGAPYAPIPID